MNDNSLRVVEVDINDILPNRFQPRIQFDEDEILELSESIKEHGVIQPIVVRRIGDKYEIIAGERRYKASVLAGKETVPVIIKNLNDKESAEVALIENIQRKNLTPIEEALSYKKILDMGYITQEQLAEKLGKSQSSVANKIRLLNLTDEVQEALLENRISERHARSLLKLSKSTDQNNMLNRIITERLTVRRTDEEIDKLKKSNNVEINNERKEEILMNNDNTNMMNNSSNSMIPNFDIFGTGPNSQINSVAAATPQVDQSTTLTPTFDMFQQQSNNIGNQTQPVEQPISNMFDLPSINSVEEYTPQVDQSTTSTPTFDIFQQQSNNIGNQTQSVEQPISNMFDLPQINSVEEYTPQVEQSTTSTPTFDMFQQQSNNIGNQTQPVEQPISNMFDLPQINSVEQPVNPNPQFEGQVQQVQPTSPIESSSTSNISDSTLNHASDIPSPMPSFDFFESNPAQPVSQEKKVEDQNSNLFSFSPIEDSGTTVEAPQPEFKMPEPIIITDYNKQYDPVMPEVNAPVEKADFKNVIAAIRECSSKIEQYGFKIDVEEYDLADIYQVVFKIEK